MPNASVDRTRPSCSAACLPAITLLASLGAPPACAVVLQAGKTAGQNLKRIADAHLEGRTFSCVVGIQTFSEHSQNSCTASGVYLGSDGKGERGYVLTAAHLFLDDGEEPAEAKGISSALIIFGPKIGPGEAKDTLQVPVTNVFFHPDCATHTARFNYRGQVLSNSMRHNDLAIATFPIASYRQALDRLGVRPAVLDEEKGAVTPLTAGKIVGFGRTGRRQGTLCVSDN